jgi:single-strand DNA-binding protein
MANLNKVFLMGRLVRDPDLRRTTNGLAVTELRMATTRTYQGRDGERRDETLFIDVTVWDRQAENCCQYLKNGSSIHVEGSLRLDTWEDKNTGEKRSKVRVVAERVQFLDGRRGDAAGSADDDEMAAAPAPRESSARRGAAPARANGGPTDSRVPDGAGRTTPQAASAADRPADAQSNDSEEDDIPF